MLDDITKEIKAQLYDRAKSPLFGTFVASWLVWNFKATAVLFSNLSFFDKQTIWWEIYATEFDIALKLFLGPLASATLFILIFPHPSRWVYEYWAGQHKKIKAIQQRIEDETPLTQDEANAIRKAAIEESTKFEARLRELNATNAELRSRLELQTEQYLEAIKARDEYSQRIQALELEVGETKKNSAPGRSVAAPGKSPFLALLDRLPPEVIQKLRSFPQLKDDRSLAVFLVLVKAGGDASKTSMTQLLKANRLDIEYGLNKLKEAGFVANPYSDHHQLTNKIKPDVIEMNLTQYLA